MAAFDDLDPAVAGGEVTAGHADPGRQVELRDQANRLASAATLGTSAPTLPEGLPGTG
jgi:hypothetical protein